MGKQLNLDTFNEILFGAFKEQTPENMLELLTVEMQSAMMMKIVAMEDVIKDLNQGKPYHQNLKKVNNIDSNLDSLGGKIEKLIQEHPELKKKAEESGIADAIAEKLDRISAEDLQ